MTETARILKKYRETLRDDDFSSLLTEVIDEHEERLPTSVICSKEIDDTLGVYLIHRASSHPKYQTTLENCCPYEYLKHKVIAAKYPHHEEYLAKLNSLPRSLLDSVPTNKTESMDFLYNLIDDSESEDESKLTRMRSNSTSSSGSVELISEKKPSSSRLFM